MKVSLFSDIAEEITKNMFVIDKHGVLHFFPWGNGKNGVRLTSEHLKSRITKFYTTLSLILVIVSIFFARIQNFWLSLEGVLASIFVYLLIWYFYTKRVIKSLSPSCSSYAEIVLEKLASCGSDNK